MFYLFYSQSFKRNQNVSLLNAQRNPQNMIWLLVCFASECVSTYKTGQNTFASRLLGNMLFAV